MKGKKESLIGIVWTGWGNECKSKQWNTPSLYIVPKPKEDGIFLCNILKKFLGKRVCITIEELK